MSAAHPWGFATAAIAWHNPEVTPPPAESERGVLAVVAYATTEPTVIAAVRREGSWWTQAVRLPLPRGARVLAWAEWPEVPAAAMAPEAAVAAAEEDLAPAPPPYGVETLRRDLDGIAPDTPVYVLVDDGHRRLAGRSAALSPVVLITDPVDSRAAASDDRISNALTEVEAAGSAAGNRHVERLGTSLQLLFLLGMEHSAAVAVERLAHRVRAILREQRKRAGGMSLRPAANLDREDAERIADEVESSIPKPKPS